MKPRPIFHKQRPGTFPAFAVLLLGACAFLFATIQAVPAAAQTSTAPQVNARMLVGTWTATFKGTTFMRLRFAKRAGKLTATLSNGQVILDSQGNISSVKVMPGVQKVKVEKMEGNTVYLRQGTKEKPLRFAFRLQDKTHAKLEILHPKPALFNPSAPAVTAPKPISLVKRTKTNKH